VRASLINAFRLQPASKDLAMPLQFHQFAYNSDNYGVLVHDPATATTTCIDAGDAGAVLEALQATGWALSDLWITHHHWDHTDGLAELKAKTGCTVTGPDGVKGVDKIVKGGDSFAFAGHSVEVIHTPGHTLDMLNFYLPEAQCVFTGDTLFVMGCGRLFEGDGPMMWASMQKLMALPPETVVYCAHEYTLASAAFALSVDPDNPALHAQVARVKALRDKGAPTVPTDIATELATNPFLRPHDAAIRSGLGMQDATDAEVFTEIRARKDRF
jgi:hydroxyacylglutathione hydrolase